VHILLTGASGFLGKIIEQTLRSQHQLDTIDRSASATHRCDLSSSIPTLSNYDLVIHAAGKAHVVPKTEAEKHAFFQVNLQGTQNLLKALEDKPPATFIFISTVAVYGRDEGHLLNEDLALDGNTPYALSKIKAEEEVKNFGLKQGWKVLIFR
jgi:nucleoside-diphosphate-sugar epimerase